MKKLVSLVLMLGAAWGLSGCATAGHELHDPALPDMSVAMTNLRNDIKSCNDPAVWEAYIKNANLEVLHKGFLGLGGHYEPVTNPGTYESIEFSYDDKTENFHVNDLSDLKQYVHKLASIADECSSYYGNYTSLERANDEKRCVSNLQKEVDNWQDPDTAYSLGQAHSEKTLPFEESGKDILRTCLGIAQADFSKKQDRYEAALSNQLENQKKEEQEKIYDASPQYALDQACASYRKIGGIHNLINHEQEVGKTSGYVNKYYLYQMGEYLVNSKELLVMMKKEYHKRSGNVWSPKLCTQN